MAVTIKSVLPDSIAEEAEIHAADKLISINNEEIHDVLDYEFYAQNSSVTLLLKTTSNDEYIVEVEKDEMDDLGLVFDTYLMDKHKTCKNKCVFCFVDQMPKGMRESLYFKDDDDRLSFLFGNYITLTNITEHEIQRIIKMKISPINISVHTMNPKLRVQMMKNPNAGKALETMKRFSDAGILMNTQLVLCPELNDGAELEYSLQKLATHASIQSVSCVPVGLTKHRTGLYELSPYTNEQAADVLSIIERFGNGRTEKGLPRLAFAGDEFYLIAEKKIPKAEFYEDFVQLENGVGLWALLKEEFEVALARVDERKIDRYVSIATGKAAYPLIKRFAIMAMEKFAPLRIDVYQITNEFFGRTITVAGLLTGQDVEAQLKGKSLGERLLLPSVMCKHKSNVFLDGTSVSELSKKLHIPIQMVDNSGDALLLAMLGGKL